MSKHRRENTSPVTMSELLSESPESYDFEAAHGEPLSHTIDLATWRQGENLAEAYERMEREIADALKEEEKYHKTARRTLLDKIGTARGAPRCAGVYKARGEYLEKIHNGLLFNGGVECCDGTFVVHDTLPITVTQIGVCLVRYNGESGSWVQRLYRRDLRSKSNNPIDELVTLLERREKRGALGQEGDKLSQLASRGIMTYAERSILRHKSSAAWRMGHGSPAPFEILTGLWASKVEQIEMSLKLIHWYTQHKRFVFIPSAPRKLHWITLGYALKPMEFAIVQTLEPELERLVDTGHYRNNSKVRQAMMDFAKEIGPKIVVGAYRISAFAPPYLFYAHVDYAEKAAHIAMADSMLQEHRSFPLLIDLADRLCAANFGASDFLSSVQAAYAKAGKPFMYLGERETRNR
ncbi:MAG: hypothetical protein V7641_4230 [Blastocatellia bacterium]